MCMHLRSVRGIQQTLLCLAVAFFVFTLYGEPAHAQSLFETVKGITLTTVPEFPSPHAPVQVSLDDYSVETTGASIAWFINGVERTEFKNERSITIQTGDVGEKSTVRVVLTRSNAPALSHSLSIVPTEIDIILEADTYVPSFYRGRALPSRDSSLRAIAVVHDGTNVPDSAYTYKWSLGNTVISGGPVTGRNVLMLDLPHFDNQPLLVEVFDSTGTRIGRNEVQLIGTEPELHFYEHSPLRGLSEREVVSPAPLLEQETTFYGEPYFLNARIDKNDADFVWKTNGEEQAPNQATPNAITLRSLGGSGEATVELSIVTKGTFPQFIQNAFRLIFN